MWSPLLVPSEWQGKSVTATSNAVVEIRSYNLKPGTRDRFQETFQKKTLPLLRRSKVDVLTYGPSLHDRDSWFLIRSFPSVAEREKSEDAFDAGDEGIAGPRDTIGGDVLSFTTIVIEPDAATLDGLRKTGS